jgi:glutamate synthase (NADPH/NADH) large chain
VTVTLLGWRDVSVDDRVIGPVARASLPVIRQVYVGRRRVVPTAFGIRSVKCVGT